MKRSRISTLIAIAAANALVAGRQIETGITVARSPLNQAPQPFYRNPRGRAQWKNESQTRGRQR